MKSICNIKHHIRSMVERQKQITKYVESVKSQYIRNLRVPNASYEKEYIIKNIQCQEKL